METVFNVGFALRERLPHGLRQQMVMLRQVQLRHAGRQGSGFRQGPLR